MYIGVNFKTNYAMKITKEEALDMLDKWLETATTFPKHDLVFKTLNANSELGSVETLINEYSFKYLLCVAYDLQNVEP